MSGAPSANSGQIALILAAASLFLVGAVLAIVRVMRPSNTIRLAAKSFDYFGICLGLAALVWRSIDRGNWMPLEDNFQTLATLALLVAGFTLYMQRVRPIPGIDSFLMPMVIVLLVYSALFAIRHRESDQPSGIWDIAHSASSFAGAAAFAVAAAVGAMYLVASARLRRKDAIVRSPAASLERLENITQIAVSCGFGLLTVGIVTGLAKVLMQGRNTSLGAHWMTSPKVILAFTVWLVYAVALHTPITPAVRGRKSAMLSIVGFVLMIATLMTVLFMPPMR